MGRIEQARQRDVADRTARGLSVLRESSQCGNRECLENERFGAE